MEQMLDRQIGICSHTLVAVPCEVQQADRLQHLQVNMPICPTGVDCVPARISRSPQVNLSVVILPIRELLHTSDLDRLIARI